MPNEARTTDYKKTKYIWALLMQRNSKMNVRAVLPDKCLFKHHITGVFVGRAPSIL
jgi:hypothetical protein